MINNDKKKILIKAELKGSVISNFFEEQGFELHHRYVIGEEYLFAINNIYPEMTFLPRLRITNEPIEENLAPMVKGYFTEEYLANTRTKDLLISYLTKGIEFDLLDRFSHKFTKISSVKVHEFLNVGYFMDGIIIEAYKEGFDISAMRIYLNLALNFAVRKTEQGPEAIPIEVSYAHDGNVFVTQISLSVEYFQGPVELNEHLVGFLSNTSFFDVTYFERAKKLTLSSVHFRETKLRNLKAYFVSDIDKRSYNIPEAVGNVFSALVKPNFSVYTPEKTVIIQSKKLAIARKFAMYITNYRMQVAAPRSIEELDLSDIDYYLGYYPKQSIIRKIDAEIKSFTLKLLKDNAFSDGINEYIQSVSNNNLDDELSEIQQAFDEKSLDDFEEIIMISGSPEEKKQVIRVKGWMETTDNETWEIKKGLINQKIKDEVVRINSEGKNILQNDIIRIVAGELKAIEADVALVMKNIVEEVVSNKVVKGDEKLEDAFALKLIAAQVSESALAKEKEKYETQVARMTKIMEQMKQELIRLKTGKNESDKKEIENSNSANDIHLKSELSKLTEQLRVKELALQKAKIDLEVSIYNKDQKIKELEEKVEGALATETDTDIDKGKFSRMEFENKALQSRLELANKKISTMYENINTRDSAMASKRDKEIDALKSSVAKAHTVIEGFKKDKLELEAKLYEQKQALKKMKDEAAIPVPGKLETAEKAALIQTLTADKRAIEDKFRLQSMEFKKTEQKLKYTISQLETATRKKSDPAPGKKPIEVMEKQLSTANSRLAEMVNEVTEKRKEVVKLKYENNLLNSKLAEFEKKLSTDKKAS